MTEELSHREIQELLGAYALDAVDGQERAIIDAHLQGCESCRTELDDHHRLAETLRRHAMRVSPLASSESSGTAKTNGHIARATPISHWPLPVAMAIIILMLAGVSVQGQMRFDHMAAASARIELLGRAQLAATDPAAVVTTLRTPADDPGLAWLTVHSLIEVRPLA